MLPHFMCPLDDILSVIILSIPFMGIIFKNLHARWHAKHHTNCKHKEH